MKARDDQGLRCDVAAGFLGWRDYKGSETHSRDRPS